MPRVRLILGLTIGIGLFGSSVNAGWHEFWDRVHLDFHRNNCWPEPFSSVDRRAAKAPFGAMVANGWKRQNTLGDAYFNETTNELTAGGRKRVFWIIKNVPEQYKTIFVSESYHPNAIESRIDSVQQEVARLLPGQSLPEVVSTPTQPKGWSADYIDAVHRKQRASIKNPVLPPFQAAGSGGGG